MKIKHLKLKKSELKGDLESLLYRADLVDKDNNIAYPQRIFISKEDARVIRRNLGPFNGLKWLNLGPSELLGNAIKPGYAIIIKEE